ncbi:MAG TPA: alkaline phosphatase family protein, partial [Rhodopila sp.]|nr:alkaline phosphatase family protein [Rhodopila sp.]
MLLRTATFLAGVAVATSLPAAGPVLAQTPVSKPLVTPQPDPGAAVAPYVVAPSASAPMSRDALIQALRQKIKYVFVIFNENHSFDNEFGTFPGANGIYADASGPRAAANTPGFTQTYVDADGHTVTVRPFRIGPAQNSTFVDSVDHSHVGLAKKLDVRHGVAAMDGFAADEYTRVARKGGAANIAMGTQFAQLVMSHIDCDTIPFFWQYANRFTLFDNIFATEDTPSTPNAIAMLAGQAGETQWVKRGAAGSTVTVNGVTGTLQGVPVVNDAQPFYGSQFDPTQTNREPRGSTRENYSNHNISENLTFASMPLLFAGRGVAADMAQDRAPAVDLPDIKQDIPFIAARNGTPVNWLWFEEGYDHEPTDPPGETTHSGYVSHHNGAQYFGYIANNPALTPHLRGLEDVFDDLKAEKLPKDGGVFYIRGGFRNIAKQTPPIQNANFPGPLTDADRAAIAKTKQGDDDHPSYSDRQISEAMAARVINAVAGDPELWRQSLIIITYDESDGFYDHVPPRILSYGPDGLPLARGIRVPMILISPYARAHVVSHAEGDHNAVIETLEALFDLPPLATLPEEKQALLAGADPKFNGPDGFVQHHLGPRD